MSKIKKIEYYPGHGKWVNEYGHYVRIEFQTEGFAIDPNVTAINTVKLWTSNANQRSTLIRDRSRYEVTYFGKNIVNIVFIDSTKPDPYSPNGYSTESIEELEIDPMWYSLFFVEVSTIHEGVYTETVCYSMTDYYTDEIFKTE